MSSLSLTEIARLGFVDLSGAKAALDEVPKNIFPLFRGVASPDRALGLLGDLRGKDPARLENLLADTAGAERLLRVLGTSTALGDFLLRHPEQLARFSEAVEVLPGAAYYRTLLCESVRGVRGEAAWRALRVSYRSELTMLAAWDLSQTDALASLTDVAAALADLAGAALDAALLIAKDSSPYREEISRVRLACIGMGKAGARELNYLSDVDVLFVAAGDGITDDRAIEIATRLARDTLAAIWQPASEAPLWEVDTNLRPEGKDGALVRTLESYLAYYERWAKPWEFQALLKASALAGDISLGEKFVAAVSPYIWAASTREGFVDSVQDMREKVVAHIPADQVDRQLKLGPGGLRDIEFTIQLVQLVHGKHDPNIRLRATLPALAALSDRGYLGRGEAATLASGYRFLRLVEHRLQLVRLRRTQLVPDDEGELRSLARGSRLAPGADAFLDAWRTVQRQVRDVHERLFYRPLLSAVAALGEEGQVISSTQAGERLAAIGFRDTRSALHHIGALTSGTSRASAIQRTLLPVILQWLAAGADPDAGLLAFRRISETLGEASWFLRTLRDSSGAALRLTEVLAGSRFTADLLESYPEAISWLGGDSELRSRTLGELMEETASILARRKDAQEDAAKALRTVRRREILRLALAEVTGFSQFSVLGKGLSDVNTATLDAVLRIVHPSNEQVEFGIVAMGSFGGEELGFGSDADLVYLYRAKSASEQDAHRLAEKIVQDIARLCEDFRLPLKLDAGLRPEGKNGPLVRSLESYRAYYKRWSLTWEVQALLRARGVAGDVKLLTEFTQMADSVRYPEHFPDSAAREIKLMKARMEAERLPRGVDATRHLKLGRGSMSDVEWCVQLLQLEYAHRFPRLRTTGTLGAIAAAAEAGLLSGVEAGQLQEAWLLASRVRSALTLWGGSSDVLPSDQRTLEGVARLIGYSPRSASRLEEDYLRITRRSRRVFEKLFY